jgi:hypothetical protein
MEPLHRILDLATAEGVLSKLPGRKPSVRASLYADDVALFIRPSRRDAELIKLSYTILRKSPGLKQIRPKA